jgi:hypothetical protein
MTCCLKVNLNINKGNQDCKIGTMCVVVGDGVLEGGGRVKEGD